MHFGIELGEVVIPFHKIVDEGVDGWFQVLPKGTLETIEDEGVPLEGHKDEDKKSFLTRLTDPDTESSGVDEKDDQDKVPKIHIRAEFNAPEGGVTDIDRETSIVVAEHMIWSSNATKDSRAGFIGSSLETFNTVRGVTGQIQLLQNQLGIILDIIETIRNTVNFTVRHFMATFYY